ncbi:Patatin family [Cordyceps militaris]|uniref:Patatin-like phospholipase domain-containing protein n=1 Tax=Cordyceps militaris TaxID=73501 RepID=A0A2H4SP92_CORMI|nr:Patatin family [Cordyceps militaris]
MVDLILPRRARAPSSPKKPSASHKTDVPTAHRQRLQAPSETNIVGKVSQTIKGANDLLLYWKDGLNADERALLRKKEERKQVLTLRMKSAETLKQWQDAAEELDLLEGNDEWKRDFSDGDYNPCLIEERLTALEDARAHGDLVTMMHLIRTELSRDLGGMGNVDLYRHSYLGTKTLIERYVDAALQIIDAVVLHSAVAAVAPRDLLEGMLLARQSFGRSALLLSGGGTFGMSHIGVLKTLFDAHLLPRIISGASAGSIVCAVLCTRTDEEIPALLRDFPHGDLAVFGNEESDSGALNHVRRLLTEGSWSDIKHLKRVMRTMMGDMTFQEAYNRTRRILNICVSTESVYELPRLLNYVTAPNVMIWSAVTASCSLPFVFHSSPLLVKDPVTAEHHRWNPSPQHFIDGSVDNDLPMTRLAEMFNVNHFIVSQVNPHVVPFLPKDDHLSPEARLLLKARQPLPDEFDWLAMFTTLARDEALHRLQFMAEMGIFPNLMTKCQSILSQKYSGDITILPEIGLAELPGLLSNPSADFMLRSSIAGERATWPKLSRIRDRCAIELALDDAVHRLRTRVVFSESQGDLRKLGAGFPAPSAGITTPQAAGGDAPAGTVQQQHRRRSGGCLRSMGDRSHTFDAATADITDDDTLEEERLEMRLRRSRGNSPVAARKPRLHRASKSQMHIPRPSTAFSATPAASTSSTLAAFDFSKPLAVPSHAQQPKTDASTSSEDEPTPPAPTRSAWHQRAAQPIEDVETSEQGHSSDADIDQASEESDPDPYDSKWESPPPEYSEAVKDDGLFAPSGRIGNAA